MQVGEKIIVFFFFNVYLFGCVGSWLQHVGSWLCRVDLSLWCMGSLVVVCPPSSFGFWKKLVVSVVYGTPLQYSCLENPMDGGAW